jgi:hypothetical protein
LNGEAKLRDGLYSLWAPTESFIATLFVSCLTSVGIDARGKVKQLLQASFAGFSWEAISVEFTERAFTSKLRLGISDHLIPTSGIGLTGDYF